MTAIAMNERTELGRISRVEYGFGGYDDAMFGLSLTFGGDHWGVSDFNGTWSTRPEGAQWTIEDQRLHFVNTAILIRDTLRKAKVKHVAQLEGIPVEVTFDNNRIKSWRILEEVL